LNENRPLALERSPLMRLSVVRPLQFDATSPLTTTQAPRQRALRSSCKSALTADETTVSKRNDVASPPRTVSAKRIGRLPVAPSRNPNAPRAFAAGPGSQTGLSRAS